jgi:outer membrane receptor protein involved in Fe transport
LYSYNSAIDEITSVQNSSPLYNNILGGNGSYNWLNTYLNLNYAYAGKYFVSVNAALDGSSRFGKAIESSEAVKIGTTPFALMPSVTAAWVVSSEKFMANKGIDLLKFRVSTGRVGNDDVGNYNFQKYYTAQSLLGNQGIVQSSVANPALKWETVNKFNVGVDLVTFKQRLSLTVDLFNNKTTDMLVMSKAPAASGLNYLLTNEGAMSTSGLEATLTVKLINKANLKWDLGATIAKLSTTVDQLPSAYANAISPYSGASYLTSVGQAPNLFYGAVAKGVYASDADATQEGLNTLQANGTYKAFKGGDVRFVDVNGDKVIDEKDNQVIGNPNPNFYGGINNRVTYKNWSLDALISFVSGNDVYNYTRRKLESGASYENKSNALI